jgi:uncharacterized protein (UPF0248 family)
MNAGYTVSVRQFDTLSDMIPIHELLARIQWDKAFGQGQFTIGYWDRLEGKIINVDLHRMLSDADNPAFFDFADESGTMHSIPLHRIREVWRDGKLIWQRPPPGAKLA